MKKKKKTDQVSDINWVNNLTKRALSWPGHTTDRLIKPSVYVLEKLLLAFHLLPPFLWFHVSNPETGKSQRDLFLFIYCSNSYHTKITYLLKCLILQISSSSFYDWLSLLNLFWLQLLTLLEAKNAMVWPAKSMLMKGVSHWLENVRSKILLSILSFVTIKDTEAIKDA